MQTRVSALVLTVFVGAACDTPPDMATARAFSAGAVSVAAPREVDETVVPKRLALRPNPLGLPAANVTFSEGKFVYTVPEAMFATAKLGGSLELRAARVESMDGPDVSVRSNSGPPYTVHAGYIVAPEFKRVERGTRVMVPHHGNLRHGTVQRQVMNQVVIRYGDVGVALGDQSIAVEEVGVFGTGLEPGAYALAHSNHELQLVLLVSAGVHADGIRRWFVLGPDGDARIVDAKELTAVADARTLKPGSAVLVAWHGTMVPATLQSIDVRGLVSVKRPRSGPTLLVGIDMVTPASAPTPGPAKR